MVTKNSQTVKNPGIICKFKDREKTFFSNSGSNVLAAAGQKGKCQERSGDHPDERQVGLAPQEHLEESHQLRRRKSVTGAAQQHKQGEPPHKRDALGNLFKVPVDFAAVNNEERCHQPHRQLPFSSWTRRSVQSLLFTLTALETTMFFTSSR